jgi:beta-1,4-galactosyltransferase 1
MYKNIIIIPYRNREEHLKYFIDKTVPLIKQTMPDTKVVVVEQAEGKLFNRGKVLNVGFKEYMDKTKYFITNDVDLNPNIEIVKELYTKNEDIISIYSAHKLSLGGIIKIKHNILFDINGFPNNIWGWGIEDRALYFRSYIKNIPITRYTNNKKNLKILNHKSNVSEYGGIKKNISDMWSLNHINKLNNKQKEELIFSTGLNNLEYKIIERKKLHDIVELIKVEI